MMAKITKGASFGGAVRYILDPKKGIGTIAADGVRVKNIDSVIRSFETQAGLNPRVSKPVGHISLDFSAQDSSKLDNLKMVAIALEYMQRMGIRDTQFIIGRHNDREHPHIHILFNRVDNNGHTISDQNDRLRSGKICKELTLKYCLYMAAGKENVKRERLREPDATKYRIYDALVKHVTKSKSWAELQKRLRAEGIEMGFKTKGSTSQVEGVRFTMNNLSFNGSKVDKMFSFSKIDFAMKQNAVAEEVQQRVSQTQQVTPPTQSTGHHHTPNLITIVGSDDLFNQNPVYDPDEAEFERQQRLRRKKKRGRSM